MKICFQWWSKFGSIIFLITVIFKLVKNSEKSKRPKPPSTTCLFITSLLILSRLQPHKKMECQGIYTFDQGLRGFNERNSKIEVLRVYKRFYNSYFTQDGQVSSVPYIHPRFGFGDLSLIINLHNLIDRHVIRKVDPQGHKCILNKVRAIIFIFNSV